MFKRVPDIVIYKIFKKHLPNHYICTFWVSVGIFVVSCIVGVFIEATDFLVNILAGVASIFIGFVIAALILSKYDEVIWIRVRKMAINNLMSDLDFIFYQILTAFHKLHPDKFISLPVKYYPPDELTIYLDTYLPEIERMIKDAISNDKDLAYQLELNKEIIIESVKDILRDVTPQLVQSHTNQELLDNLFELKGYQYLLGGLLDKSLEYSSNHVLFEFIQLIAILWNLSNKEANSMQADSSN